VSNVVPLNPPTDEGDEDDLDLAFVDDSDEESDD
jgi:hypothetical protein